MLLFHGFPSASHMFRDLMPMLEDKFHCIAPDYPGFGNTDSPPEKSLLILSIISQNTGKIRQRNLGSSIRVPSPEILSIGSTLLAHRKVLCLLTDIH